MKYFLSALCALGLGFGSAEAADFKIKTESALVNFGTLHASFVISNSDSLPYHGNVKVRAFLIPKAFSANGSPHAQPVLLPSSMVSVNLAANGSEAVRIKASLPYVPADQYYLAAYVNHDVAVSESVRNNNVTEDLFDLGAVESDAPSPETQAADLYLDVPVASVRTGSVAVPWRLFKRGAVETGANFICLFLVADLNAKKLFVSTYEKGTHWIVMGNDLDSEGRTIPFDVYQNPVSFNHLKSGEYGILTWVDSREMLREADSSNNMNMRRVTVSRARLGQPSEGWTTVRSGDVQERTLSIVNDFSGEGTWSIDPASLPAGVTLTPMSGTFGAAASRFNLQLRITGSALAEGASTGQVQILAQQGTVSETVVLPLRVLKTSAELMAAAPALAVGQEVRKNQQVTGTLTLRNTLADTAHFQVSSPSQAIYGLGQFALSPGEVRSVPLTVDSRAMSLGAQSLSVVVNSTGYAAAQTLPFVVHVLPPQ